jgi:hypothetical protein
MRKSIVGLVVVLIATVAVGAVALRRPTNRSVPEAECGSGTLDGAYSFSSNTVNPTGLPSASVGRMVFDGHGGWQATFTAVADAKYVTEKLQGSYEVLKDCTGSMVAKSESGRTRLWFVSDVAGNDLKLLGGPAARYAVGTASRQIVKTSNGSGR